MAVVHGISVNEALSGVFGSISLTAWICLLLPQLLTNYRAQSAEGLSMPFLLIWLFGDIANLGGALVTGIAPTATALAAYFCFSDLVLISQCLYYNTLTARRARQRTTSSATDASEDEPLLRRRRASSGAALPGSQRRNSMRHEESGFDPIRRVVTGEDETPDSNPALHNALSIAAVYIVGALGWFVSYKAGAWDTPESPDLPEAKSTVAIIGMSLGLALLFFLLSLTGNLTYGASVFSYSQNADDIIKAIPWLLGSLGTMVEDCIIFYQFSLYAPKQEAKTHDVV
ncbi:uncharacterized protein PG998_010793 [Apiospora kogelbergensis]|uniref:uncharacterized protein n=1 Tax=Apiospora kogelbergensis TaxID=1337665 RepID=UPI00312E7966